MGANMLKQADQAAVVQSPDQPGYIPSQVGEASG